MAEYLFNVVDFETTDDKEMGDGEIIEIGVTSVWFDPETMHIRIGEPLAQLFRPTRGIPVKSQAVHHISMADVEGATICTPDDLRRLCCGGDPLAIVAHFLEYEQHWLTPEIMGEIKPICTNKAAKRLWTDAPEHKNQTLRYWLGLDLPADKAMPPHRAGPDSFVTAHIFARMLKEVRAADLVKFTRLPHYYHRFPIGKHKGQLWSDIPHDYFTWMLKQPDMEEDLKHAARAEIERRRDAHT